VQGYRELAGLLARGELDLGYARRTLVGRFGSAAVAERLMDVYAGRDATTRERV
jgi:hypothetical protein